MDLNAASSAFRVSDRSNVAEVRRAAGDGARALGWTAGACGESELVATELATNLLKHARDGTIAVAPSDDAAGGLLIVAVDRGPGIADMARCFTDGYSTAGSPGTGLGAIRRLAHRTDVVSSPEGTIMLAELRDRSAAASPAVVRGPLIAGFVVPKEGEAVSGDAWARRRLGDRLAILVCDGLGHGYEANKAAARTVECFNEDNWQSPKDFLERANQALRPTRGAAAAVALIDPVARRARYAGVGNIVAGAIANDRAHHWVSHNGILGNASRIAEFEYEWPPGAVLIMHSDGLTARWQVARWSNALHRHPALLAGVAYRDLARGTDDAVVVVASDHADAA